MSQVKVTLRPKGLATVAVIAIAVLGYGAFALKQRGPQPPSGGGTPVGGLSSAGTDAAPGASPQPTAAPANQDEIAAGEESAIMDQMNADVKQRRDWLFLGPLPSGSSIATVSNEDAAVAQMHHIINTQYLPGEAKYQAHENATVTVQDKPFQWRKVTGSAFDFRKMFATPTAPVESFRNVVVYGVTYIDSETTQKKVLHFRSDDGAVVWLNGTQLYRVDRIRGLRDEDLVPMTLRPGRNTILVKVGQGSGGWGMMTQLEDAH